MLSYTDIPESLLTVINNIDDMSGVSDYPCDSSVPLLYHILQYMYQAKDESNAVAIFPTKAEKKDAINRLLIRLDADNNSRVGFRSNDVIAMRNDTVIEFYTINEITTDGIRNDEVNMVFFDFTETTSSARYAVMKEVFYECLINLTDGYTRDMFTGVSTKDLNEYLTP